MRMRGKLPDSRTIALYDRSPHLMPCVIYRGKGRVATGQESCWWDSARSPGYSHVLVMTRRMTDSLDRLPYRGQADGGQSECTACRRTRDKDSGTEDRQK